MIIKAILKINPSAEVLIKGDNIDTCEIDWIKGTPISKEDIKLKDLAVLNVKISDLEKKQF